jgi:hypothetical protein
MGSIRGGNGDGRPPSDDGGLPDFPPEWGVVVIPDDLTELDRETAALQRERRRSARRTKWRRRLGLPSAKPGDGDNPPVGIPLLIMSIAIIAALTSLFAITLTNRGNPTTTPTTPPVQATTAPPQMIDLALTDATGKRVQLRETLPAVILLLDGCACDQLIRDTVALAPPSVTVIAVDKTAPILPAGVAVTALADPEQALMATYNDGPDRAAQPAGEPTAVLVDSEGAVTKIVSSSKSVNTFSAALTGLR